MRHSRWCLDTILTIGGWVFDLSTVALNLAEGTTNLLLVVYFFNMGEHFAFGSVLFLLVQHSIAGSVAAVVMQTRGSGRSLTLGKKCLLSLLCTPVGLLAPTFHWINTTFSGASSAGEDEERIRALYAKLGCSVSSDASKPVAEVDNQMYIMARVQVGLNRVMKHTHTVFYAPPAVSALLFMFAVSVVMFGNPTTLQLIATSLLLLSLVSKAYVVTCTSFTFSTMLFKFTLVAHDLFNWMYTFSSAFKGTQHNYLGHIIILRWVGFLCLGVMVCFGSSIYFAAQSSSCKRRIYLFCSHFFLHITCHLYPAIFVADVMKLSWIVLSLIRCNSLDLALLPQYTHLFTFVRGGDPAERIKHILAEYTQLYFEARSGGNEASPKNHSLLSCLQNDNSSAIMGDNAFDDYVSATRKVLNGGLEFDGSEAERTALMNTPYILGSAWSVEKDRLLSHLRGASESKRLQTCGVAVFLTVYAIGQLYGFLFPFLNVIIFYEHQTTFQLLLFSATAFSLFVALVLTPHAISYFQFCRELSVIRRTFPLLQDHLDLGPFAKLVHRSFHSPQHHILLANIPFAVLPPDVIGVVNSLLGPHSLHLDDLCAAESEALYEQWNRAAGHYAPPTLSIDVDESSTKSSTRH